MPDSKSPGEEQVKSELLLRRSANLTGGFVMRGRVVGGEARYPEDVNMSVSSNTSAKSPFAWYGGKAKYAAWLIEQFPKHLRYVEPFGGAGHVLFAKPASIFEVYNDLDGRLVNFYAVVRDAKLFEQLRLALELTPHARQEFARILDAEPVDDPVEMARRFFVLMRQARGGLGMSLMTARAWAVSRRVRRKMPEAVSKYLSAIDGLPAVHERLREVTIEHLPALEVIKKYDDKDTFFYLDPSYLPETRHGMKAATYGCEMTYEDHVALLDRILVVAGTAMISGYASQLYDDKLKGWRREELVATAHVANSGQPRVEVVWMNY